MAAIMVLILFIVYFLCMANVGAHPRCALARSLGLYVAQELSYIVQPTVVVEMSDQPAGYSTNALSFDTRGRLCEGCTPIKRSFTA